MDLYSTHGVAEHQDFGLVADGNNDGFSSEVKLKSAEVLASLYVEVGHRVGGYRDPVVGDIKGLTVVAVPGQEQRIHVVVQY